MLCLLNLQTGSLSISLLQIATCIKQYCITTAGIWTKCSLYFNIIPIQVCPCCLTSLKCWQDRAQRFQTLLCCHQLSWKTQGALGTQSFPFSSSPSYPLFFIGVCLLRVIMKCAIIVTGKTKDKVIQKKRGREEIGLVTIFHVTGIIDNLEPG